MFIQVIQGHVAEPAEVRHAFDEWMRELAPGAPGWLGTTAGVTADGELVAAIRFESAEAAQRNSQRPEQHQWWMETSKLFAGGAIFHDSDVVDLMLDGGSDDAGFVQVIQARTSDPARLRELGRNAEATTRDYRPDIIGGITALHNGDRMTQVVYFTSEDAAREGERKAPPPELAAVFDEEASLLTEVRYLDLTEPWFYSPVPAASA